MPTIYAKPPILEALCEIRLDSGQTWDLAIPGLLYSEVKHIFPQRQQRGDTLEVEFDPATKTLVQKPASTRAHFLSDDGRMLMQVGTDLLVINHLAPYSSWVKLKEKIDIALRAYVGIASPKTVLRVGLRYINRLTLPLGIVPLGEYLTISPNRPPNTPETVASWAQRLEIPFVTPEGLMILQTGNIVVENPGEVQGVTGIMLDLDFGTITPRSAAVDEIMDWLEAAHSEIETTFENCITDQARATFGERIEK